MRTCVPQAIPHQFVVVLHSLASCRYPPSRYPDKDGGQTVEVITARVGVYGWRKYCLYFSLLLILSLAIMNMGLMVRCQPDSLPDD